MLISDPVIYLCGHIRLVISGKASQLNTVTTFCIDDTAFMRPPCLRPAKGDLAALSNLAEAIPGMAKPLGRILWQ